MSKALKCSTAIRWTRMSEARDERAADIRAAFCPHADGHADLHLARAHRAYVLVHDDTGAHRERRPEIVQWSRQFRNHGNTVFYSSGVVPHAWWRRATHDQLYDVACRALARRTRVGWGRCLCAICCHLRFECGDGCGDRLDYPPCDGSAGLSKEVRSRCGYDIRRARHPGAAVDHPGAVRRFDQYLDRDAVHGRYRARCHSRFYAGFGYLV